MIEPDPSDHLESLPVLAGGALPDTSAGSAARLSYGERSLWFLHHLAPGDGAYNIAAAAAVRSPLASGALERAFQGLVDRHAALRTAFPAVAGEPCRRIEERAELALAREDATGWSEERLRSRLAEEAWRPFDIERGPLLRVTLLEGGPGGPVILLVIHHIVADFWSLAVLLRELPVLYREAIGSGAARLPAPGWGAEEQVRLEREALAGGRGEALLAWWRERLAGLPTLELVTDRPRPAVQTYRGDCRRLRLPGELAAALRARGRAQHGTLFMTLVAAFQALLCRHTGQEDLAIGAPRAGRSHARLAGTVGYFVNPVVLRGDLSGDPTFTELLERTRAMVLAAFEHGDCPLPLLAEQLQPARDASRTPLFQVSFVMQKETRGVEGLTAFALGEEGVAVGPEDFRLESLSLDRPPAPFDLQLHLVERQGGLSLALQYNTDLFDGTTAERLLERFATLLGALVRSPDLALSALPIASEVERHQLLCAWNDTAQPGSPANLFELFSAQAEQSPDEPAVVFEDEQVTYRELAARAEALAYHLAGLGVGPEALVGVAAERSVELVVGLLGVLGAGGAYLPLEPDLPRQRLEMILADSRPSVLLTRRSLVGALPLDAVPGVRLAWLEEMADLPRGAAAPRLPRTAADNAAYVLFTSGSTGRPKGVVNSHRGIVNRLLWMQEALGLDASDRFLQKTPFGFDVSVPEFFMPLILGGRLIVARPEGHRDSAYLSRLVEREGVTTIHFVPSMLPFFLAEEGVAARCRSLRRVIVSGEALAWELEQRCLEVLPAPLYNLYGPTEAAVEVMAWQCRPAARPRPVPIGRPILNTQIHVVGRRLEPVPAGAVGELVIGGVQVARGYRGRSDLTAERFVPDPFGPPGARLYRTGDLCRHLPGGEIEYLGRLDDQVKIRGVRIEPREIEIALTAHPEVREAAVVVRQDPAGERSLLACMVLREGEPGPAEAAALRDFLTARLPPSMVPAVAFGAELPRLPNGKLDRRALARWTPAAESARSFLAPRTPLEELLAGLFAELLGVDRIGVADSFFEAGGHSLAAMRLIARVRETLGVDLPLYRVFEMPTVADLVRSIEGAARSEVPPLVPVPRDRPLPLSFAQQRLWFLHQLEPASPAYNMSAAVHLEGRLDRAALAAALGDVVRRHETLRTRFAAPGGEPVQVIDPPALLPVPMVDLAYLPAGCRTEEARRLVRAEALRPFDLAAGPLLRVALVRLGDSEQLLLLAMHHIVGDAWSLRVLARELAVLYSAFAEGLPSPLPELEIQYGDYTVWQRRWFQGETLEAELAHWRSRLADAPSVLDLPLDRPRSAGVSDRGASRAVALPPALLPSLQALARRQRVTLFMAVLAAFQALLSRVSNTEDVSVGTPVAGRRQIRTEGLIGFFVNTLVMRTDLSGDPSFTALLARVREVALAAYAHQDLPFDRLVEELHPRRDLSHAPLFQVSFDLDDEPPPPPRLGEVAGSLWPLELETEKFDLRLTLTVEAEVLSGALGFRTGLFDGATIERLAGHFMRLLVGAVQESWRRLSELPLLSAEEREQILVEWNDTATAAQRAPLVHELVLAWARRRPESLAVTAPGERLAYGELAARARSLARVLGRLGVGPEVRVALCAGPTVHRVVGSLAVLLAGGVYVPLDPEAPPERLSFLVADSGAAVVLTEQALAGRLHECTARRLLLEEAGRVEEKGLFSASVVDPDNLAYVVYTSGSTGLPKGVAISHAGLLNLVRWHCERYGVGPADRATLIANPAFDASVWEIWPYLAAGASLHVPSEEMRLAPSAIVRFWRREGITWSFLPTPLAEEVIAEPSAWAGLSLKGLLCGGDRLHRPPETALPFSLINHYGPSEVSVVTTCTAVRPGLSGAPPIGRPILNLRTYVVALHGALAPRGVAGELWIGGEGLGRGYLARPDLTAERFVPDPWSGEAGGRLYRTGDLMRHQRDGSLEFLGRIDHQIKLRGFRIEPGEIEAVLRAHPAVSEAVVATFAPRREHRRLVAYVVGVEGRAPSSHELRKFLRERLPGYMVPGVFVALPALPLTPNGKLDRKALPEPAPEAGEEIVAPRTPAEELVAGIFAEVLGLEQVGVNESFFELGGHSLLATQVASRVHTVFGVELPVRAVFEAPTVLELAGWIETSAADERSRGPAIVPVSRDEPPPMSFAQERLWFLDRLEPGSPLYNIPVAVALTGRLDVPVLAAALSTVVERHETLRTTFGLAGGPVQIIALHATVALPVIDLRDLPGMARAAEVERLAAAEARRPFDLGHLGGGPLLRSTLVALALQEHLALITLPHIVSDGWSMGVLVHELGALYAAFLDRRPSPLPELSIQYADFAVWQRSRLSGELLESELAWWRGQLAGMPPALELPTDHPRPAVRTIGGAVHGFTIARESLGALAALSRRHGTTLFMTLLAGFLALLKRTTGADDLVVGSPIAGRLRVETEPLIGLFVNTLVLRTDLSGDPDFLTLLGRVRETTLAAYVHQEVPFERLVEELAPERDLSRPPLVQVVLALQNAPTGPLELPGLLLTPSAVHTGTAKFELTCLVMETERGLEGTLEYSRRLLDGPTVERLAQRFTRLLAGAAADPQRRLSELPLLASGERHQILAEWNDTRAPFPAETLLHQFFEAAVDRAPQTVAAVCGSSALTYGELEAWANRLAHLLRSAGIGRGAPVGVWVERSFGMLAAVLGILKAGGHYVALDETWPADRVEAILAATGVPAIVTGSGLLAAVEEMGGRLPELAEVVCLDLADPRPAGGKRWWTAWHLERSAASRPPAVSGPDDIAYVIHTSGSTGEPKGIVVQHRPAANLIDWINRTFAVGPEDRGLFVTSLCFDLSVYDIFGLLAAGGTVHIAAKEDLAEPDRLVDLMRTGGITLWDSAPAALVQLAPLFPAEPERASRLRRVLLSGDWIPVTLPDRVRRAFPEAQVLALGGATEATVWSNWYPVGMVDPAWPSIPYGRPIANARYHVLDAGFSPCPIGVPGDLYIGGGCLCSGYARRPDLTARAFLPDPFVEEPGARLYRTGDRARYKADGNLEFLGRVDHQVKIRGYRIELGEIEVAIARHPEVREAVVLVREDQPGDRRLVAYVVPASAPDSPALSPADLRDALRRSLPDYMVPSAFVLLSELPVTPNGKLDRTALPAPVRSAARGSTAPQTPLEETLAEIWADVLGVAEVGREDSFFDLGGHSLLATQLMARIREVWGVELPLRALFERPTLEDLAAAVEAARATGEPSTAPALRPIARTGQGLPLSFAQQRLWFLDQLEPGSPVYNIPAAVELTGRLDPAVLAAALGEVVRRHETLRTTFRSAAGEPVQVVAEDAGFLLPVVDLQALPGREREHEAHRLATAEARRPFDLACGPLLRAALLRSGTEQHVVLLTMHHIVSDGWSMGVLVRELGVLYEALVAGRPSPLLELALQYADFAAWQRQSLSGARLESELAWWRGQLAGMPAALDLPADHPRPVALSTRGAVRELALDGECLAGLNGLARRHGATLFMTLLAGFAGLLWRCTGQDDLAVGTPVAGRTRAETEPLIGFFVNTLVLRLDLAGEPSFEQLLERVRETTLSAYAHQEIPFERLVEELVAQRDRSRPPLVQVMFALQNAPLGVLALPGLELRAVQAGTGTAMFELTFVLGETASGLAGMIEYSTDLFEAPTTGRLAGHFERLLAAAVAGPEQRLDDLALLSEAERHQLLVEWGAAPRDTPRRTSLFALFAASAERAPDAVAVVSGGERLTYGELDARSARWARHLRRCGTGPETIVGVCLEPSPDLLVALLAIWRAGGAFLPLDPAYPLERLAFMLEDSGAPLVVTRGVPLDLAVPGVRRIGLDDLAADSSPDPAEPAVVRPEDLAYVIYTSGSTGRPKGVAVQQGEAAAHIETIVADWELGSADRVLQFASPSFDVWIEETVPPLVAGATLVLRGTELWEPAWFLDRARELGLTVIDLPTAYWHQWVREGLAGEGPEAVPADLSLRLVVVGGEAMSVEAARLWWRSPLCGVRLVNSYGPTEAVITATSCVVGAACAAVASASLGPPLPGRSALVLDRGGHLQPVGVPGELCVGGGVLARGYLHRPDLTAERFVPDPFSSSPGGRLYRTGDLARHLPDGRLESLGRIDHQVKVRGFRIELGEIEAALLAHRGVKAAAVLAGGEPAGGASLVAYAVVSPGETPGEPLGPSALRDFLRERLPPYMVPSFFVNLPALPLTPGGKVDRKALRALGPQTGPVETAVGRPPRTPTEELVAGIFADVLGLERVGSEDDFFELGGHSLLATRVTARVQAVFGVELPVRAVFEAPTVAGLAGRLEGAAGDRPRKPAIARVSRQEPLPLSFAQQRLWFLDQLEPGSPVYNIPAAVELTGRLDVAVLAAALGEVVRRHEALRTTFQVVVGEPVQGVAEDAGFALPLVDLQALPGCEREARRLAVAEARRPFDLGCGPLLRATVLRTGAERHVLLVTMHHIVSDGWSMGVLVRELGVLYGALVAGRPSPLPELALQYVDFAAWQRQALSGARMGLDLAWWRGQLAGMAPAVDLPTDHPRPATRSVRGAVHRFAIDREGLSGLMALSRRHGATLFMTLLAGFAALLQRITGQDNLAVGTPVAGRTVVETEPLIGLFVNTLVLRVDLAGDPELAELLGRVRETALSALAHQEMPFERLVEELVEERDPSRPPLVQVLLALQNAPEGPLELPGLALTSSPVETGTARLELACALTETEGGLEGEIEYSRDLFDGTTVARMAGHFVRLLAGAVDGPRRRLSGLPLLSAGERQQLLEWNATATPYRLDRSLHELIEEQVRRTPAAPAVVAEDESLAYGEFNGRANRLARRLRDCGVGPETVVAICAERSAALVVGLLAILKAGGAYLPLDPDYPTERLLFMLQDARASLLLTTGELAARLGEQGPAILRLDDRTAPWWSPERDAGGNLGIAVQPGNLAYVIYTSGSTGRPKGTMNAHLGIVNRLLWMQERFDLGPGDRVLQKTPVSFDVSVWELFWPLINGAILVMARPGGHRDAAYLWRTIEEHGITTLHFVPSMLRAFLEGAPPSAERLSASSLVRVLASGETLGHDLQELYSSRLEAPLYNLYGPTEAAVDVTHWSCDPADARPLVPIGRPVANTRIHLLDRQAQEVPVGVPGEPYIGGVQVARGYLGRPDLTAERFVPDVGGARLYRTGDLARYLPDGAIDYLGRCDDQVKIRGFRIELGEIEAVLAGHPAVREAAVLLRTDLPGGSGLVAYVAADEAGRGRSLRGWLEERLPGYMVPAAFVELESLPLSVNGKVDRKALAKLRPERETSLPVAPRTPAEELLAGIFAEVLGVDRVGITEDFFALGGHSLLATRVASRVRTVFGVELPVRAIFQAPTVEALAGHLERSARAVGGRIERSERRGEPLALSFAQQRLWVLDQLEPGSPLYSIPVAVELIGRLEEAALAAALEEVVRRHEALRTTFRSVEGEPVQVIAEPTAFTLPQVDLRGLPVGEGREREVSRLAEDEARRPFDLGCDPLLRCTLVRAGADAHVLLLTMHHIVSDAWSIDVLVRELGALYASFAAGRPSPLPELPIQYADFAAWQRHHLAGGLLAAELAWWRGQLAGIPPALELPTDHPRPVDRSVRGAVHDFTIDREELAGLTRLSRRHGTTLFMTVLAGFAALLQRFTDQDDVVVGTPVAGRTRTETEPLIGFFINTLALRIDLSGAPVFVDLLARVRETALSAYAHQDVPFERLVEELAPERDRSRPPIFQVVLALQNAPSERLTLPGLEVQVLPLSTGTAKFELSVVLGETAQGLTGMIEFSRDLFAGATIGRLAGHLTRLLAAAVADPHRPLPELSLLSPGERHQLLLEWNDTRAPFPETLLLHQFFEVAVERAPEAVAAVCAGSELTYAGLEARSNRLAWLLRERGVQRGTPVGIWVERGFDMLTTVLGILKAGGHYVALDEAWPADRVESILAATGAPAIIAGAGLLEAVEEMRWRLPALSDVVCLAIADPELPAEVLDAESVRELWDFVAERAVDRVTAGGFVSAFTGEPMSEAEVDEYRDRVLSLSGPWLRPEDRVLEIGNGSGLLLWEVAFRVAHVTGIDPSPLTQERNRERAVREGIANVELRTGFAHEIDEILGAGERFDLVLLASTVQFFPGPYYLERVVRQALARLAPGGALVIADVLDARRREELRRAIGEHRGTEGGASAGPGRELYLDEEFFKDLGATVHHRTEGFANELRFRYDVLFTAGPAERRKRLWTGWHVDRCSAGRLPSVAGPDDIAYVIHTSGSTGEPKGIAVQHRPAANLIDWVNRTFDVGPEDCGLFVTSLCFDLSVYDIFGLLAAGGTVHVALEEDLGDPDRLVSLLRTGGITLWDSAPAALVQLAPLFPAAPEPSSRLRRVLLSGDWIPVTLPDRVRRAFPEARVMALGGATEATVWSNWFPVGSVDPEWPSIPYGRPIANARYHVLDAGFSPCPIGIPGDLYIGGDCLCTGYARRPDLTAQAFLPDPFSDTPGARLYRTGDRARAHADGNLEFLGRLDQQVKVRGYRIELGEIEVALCRDPGVREAVVLAREDTPGDQRLVAYVVPQGERTAGPSPADLRDHLRRSLPEYMIPAGFVTLAELPVTANGKLDRRALPPPQWGTGTETGSAAALTPVEEIVARLWAEVLGLPRVGPDDNFFELGGHSLSGTQVVSRLRQAFQVDLPLRALFAAPTVAGLAAEIEARRGPDRVPEQPVIASFRRDRSAPPPLSFAQERFWAARQAEARSRAPHTIPMMTLFEGELDVALLRQALQGIVDRHEAMRTSFREDPAGRPVQVVHPVLPVVLPVVDLREVPVADRMAVVRDWGILAAQQPFDYERVPLFRLFLFRCSQTEHVLFSVVHHITFDGWSSGLLSTEIAALYNAFRSGRPSPLAPLPLQYQDFARWQRHTVAGEALDRQVAFWREHLDSALPLDLGGGRQRPKHPQGAGIKMIVVPKDLERKLEDFAAEHCATLFMTLLAAFNVLLHFETGRDDIVVVCLFANRDNVETEGLIGNFYAGLPLRTRLAGVRTFRELLEQVREVTLAAHEHPDILYERVFDGMSFQDEADPGGLSTFRVLFQLAKLPAGRQEDLDGLKISRLPFATETMRADLSLFLFQESRLNGRFRYNRDVLTTERAVRLRDRYLEILAAVAADADRPIAELLPETVEVELS